MKYMYIKHEVRSMKKSHVFTVFIFADRVSIPYYDIPSG